MALGSGRPEHLTDACSAPSWSVEASFGTFCDDALTGSGRRFRVLRKPRCSDGNSRRPRGPGRCGEVVRFGRFRCHGRPRWWREDARHVRS